MKKITLILATALITLGAVAQGNSQGHGNGKGNGNGNGNGKGKNKTQQQVNDQSDIFNGNQQGHGNSGKYSQGNSGKYSKNQPAKVRDAFYRDYPNASNVVWTKDRGNWTATFGNGIFRSTAVYHANGQRQDTRTAIQRRDLPNGSVWDRIFKRDRVTPTGEFIRIERPNTAGDIFRMAIQKATGQKQYYYYDANGNLVQYNY